MKALVAFLTCILGVTLVSSASVGQTYDFTIENALVAGQPQAIYETSLLGTAHVTITSISWGTCRNISQDQQTAYCSDWAVVSLMSLSTFNFVLTQIGHSSANGVLHPGQILGVPTVSPTRSGDIPVDLYRATAIATVGEDKTGDELDAPSDQRDVDVRPYA